MSISIGNPQPWSSVPNPRLGLLQPKPCTVDGRVGSSTPEPVIANRKTAPRWTRQGLPCLVSLFPGGTRLPSFRRATLCRPGNLPIPRPGHRVGPWCVVCRGRKIRSKSGNRWVVPRFWNRISAVDLRLRPPLWNLTKGVFSLSPHVLAEQRLTLSVTRPC